MSLMGLDSPLSIMNDGEAVMVKIELLQSQVDELKHRNFLKDQDKAFESSWTRTITIICLTYGTLFGYMWGIGVNQPALSAIVPTVGFTLSTLSLPYLKQFWYYFRRMRPTTEERVGA